MKVKKCLYGAILMSMLCSYGQEEIVSDSVPISEQEQVSGSWSSFTKMISKRFKRIGLSSGLVQTIDSHIQSEQSSGIDLQVIKRTYSVYIKNLIKQKKILYKNNLNLPQGFSHTDFLDYHFITGLSEQDKSFFATELSSLKSRTGLEGALNVSPNISAQQWKTFLKNIYFQCKRLGVSKDLLAQIQSSFENLKTSGSSLEELEQIYGGYQSILSSNKESLNTLLDQKGRQKNSYLSFIDYQFLSSLSASGRNSYKAYFKDLSTSKSLVKDLRSITIQLIGKRGKALKIKKDSILQKQVYKQLQSDLLKKYNQDLENLSPIDLSISKDSLTSVIRDISKNYRQAKVRKNNKLAKDKMSKEVRSRAKAAKLSKDTTKKLIALFSKKQKQLFTYEASKRTKKNKRVSELDIVGSLDGVLVSKKSLKGIEKNFKVELAKLLSSKDYRNFYRTEILAATKKDREAKALEVIEQYELNDLQTKKVVALIDSYYSNRFVIGEYYPRKGSERKRKQQVLDFKFDKSFKSLMKDFGVEVKNRKVKSNVYQWN